MGNRLSEGNIMVVAMLTIIIILLGLLGYWIIPKIQSKLEESKNNI
jgi:F0F1-type ATP synthase membrane subunit b/b'